MGLAKVDSGTGDQRIKPKPGLNIIAGMFFDGTGNNQNNTNVYNLAHGDPKKHKAEDIAKAKKELKDMSDGKSSYENDWSNVARLLEFYDITNGTATEKKFKVYIEGVGTRNNGEDSSGLIDHDGGAFGAGQTGIRAKVKTGCKLLAQQLSKASGGQVIHNLTIDVFGFSRGSAAARNFANEATRFEEFINIYNPEQLEYDGDRYKTPKDGKPGRGYLGTFSKENGVQVNTVTIRYVGLFDTVSSYAPTAVLWPDFDDDIRELHLDAVRLARRVVHLTAADEHRKNFSLTNISSTGARTVAPSVSGATNVIHTAVGSKSIQLSLPGVHSDVGGCYRDGIEEKVLLFEGTPAEQKAENDRLVAEAWFTDDQITYDDKKVWGKRQMRNQYSYIPLHMMCDFANKFSANMFKKDPLETSRYLIPEKVGNNQSLLDYIKKRLYAYAFDDNTKPLVFDWFTNVHARHKNVSTPQQKKALQDELADQANLRVLRNKYLHWSADLDQIGMGPNIENRKIVRHVYDDVADKKNKHFYGSYDQ
jgi:Uncharacterized alpha/beta hydrolase domain (DUF2235)